MARDDAQLVSFVLPVFNEALTVPVFHEQLLAELNRSGLPYEWEFIYVDDGSHDASLARLTELAELDPRVQVLEFSRNFGHQMAVTAGLDHSSGAAAVVMDTDLQDPPAVAVQLIRTWADGYNVVYAQRASRQDTLFKRVTAAVFYRVLRSAAEIEIPRDTGDFRLIDRSVMDALQKFPERSRFLRGMVAYVGFKQAAVQFDRDERYAGKSGYPLKKMVKFAGDGLLGFSMLPLRLISMVGWLIAGIAGLGILYIVVRRVFDLDTLIQPGWSAIVIAILGVGGIQIIMLSVLGSYLGRVYREVQARPLYLIAHHVNKRIDQRAVPTRAPQSPRGPGAS